MTVSISDQGGEVAINTKAPDINITDLSPGDEDTIRRPADLLYRGFREHNPDAWPGTEAALQEVRESLQSGRISRVAIDKGGNILGWIGGIKHTAYKGNVWELHPVVVEQKERRKGIGRSLVKDLEERIKERGGVTIYLGADDEDYMTTVSGVDLYPNVLEKLSRIKNVKGHPYEFYQKVGFTIIGIMPDANGPGKPDIFMSKRVGNI